MVKKNITKKKTEQADISVFLKLEKKLDSLIDTTQKNIENINEHIKQSNVRKEFHRKLKESIKKHHASVKQKTIKRAIKKHHNKVHTHHKEEEKRNKKYQNILKKYKKHIERFKKIKQKISSKLNDIKSGRITEKAYKSVYFKANAILKKLK